MADFPIWVGATHFLNIVFMTLLARSGVEVLSAFPKLYVRDDCFPGTELIRFTRKRFRAQPQPRWTSQDEEESWSPVIALPGRKNLGLGRHWHFLTIEFWIATGAVYVTLLFATGEWHRIVPTDSSIVPDAVQAVTAYLSGNVVEPPDGVPYNAAQQLAYFAVVFVLAPLQILTGAAMSPSMIARFPRYPRLFGGRQTARTLHFLGLCAFAAFVVVHTAMVIVHGVPREFAAIVLTSYSADHTLALIVGLAGLAVVAIINAGVTIASLRQPRRVQRLTATLVNPFERLLVQHLSSKQAYEATAISSFFRVNGRAPANENYRQLASEAFAGYRLRVRGLVEDPLALSLDELRSLGWDTQITLHNCIQGWTAIAQWAGVPLAVILRLCRPRPDAEYVLFRAFDDLTARDGHGGHYYGTLPIALARQPQTMLALEMNGRPLSVEHGAPIRLRVETQLGFKMVKWISSIELIRGYADIGMGQGGSREDKQYYTNFAGI